MEAIILAGGLGTRLRQVVPGLPKPMAPVNGRPFLEYQMDYWIDQGVRRFILSVGYRHEIIERHFGVSYRGAELAYAVERTPLGTGGGLLMAAGKILAAGPWLVLNGDTFFAVTLAQLRHFHDSKRAEVTLCLFPVEHNNRYTGVEIDEEGRIVGLQSRHTGARQLINGGVYLLGEAALADLPCRAGDKISLETDILEQFLSRGKRLFGHVVHERFIDIGIPEDYARAASVLTGKGN